MRSVPLGLMFLLLILSSSGLRAEPLIQPGVRGLFSQNDLVAAYRPVEDVFDASLTASDAQTLVAFFHIEPGYLLYRDEFHFELIDPPKDLFIAHAFLPAGDLFDDPKLGQVQTYAGMVDIPLMLNKPAPPGIDLTVVLRYRGCLPGEMCYPAVTKQIKIAASNAAPTTSFISEAAAPIPLSAAFFSRDFALFLLTVYLAGLGMAFSACVYPMIPIVSALTTGEDSSYWRALILTSIYVLSLALTYAVIGALIGWLGWNLQAWSQMPVVLISMSILFGLFACSLLGQINLDLPSGVKSWISSWHAPTQAGRMGGAVLLGVVSALVVGPCTTPVLGAALAYVAGEGGVLGGAVGLFVLGLGMGAPLLLIGLGLQVFLPRSGVWMHRVRTLMGCLMLGVAVLFMSRLLAPALEALIWAGWLLICAAIIVFQERRNHPFSRAVLVGSGLLFVMAVVLLTGWVRGASSPRDALMFWRSSPQKTLLSYRAIHSEAEFVHEAALAREANLPVLVKIAANWCSNCRAIDRMIQESPEIQNQLALFYLLELDLSEIDENKESFLRAYEIYGPPMFLCVPSQAEVSDARHWVSEGSADALGKQLKNCQMK